MSLQRLIADALAATPSGRPLWIALSGGLDSCLLLTLVAYAARQHPHPIYAVHVNHGLQSAATDFERHCRRFCSRLGVPLFVEHVSVKAAGQGIEAAARQARYAAFERRVKAGETLWLAQHADDQAETLLLAALRGSGVRGLAGMPVRRDWQGRQLVRPLLGCSRAVLEEAARELGLDWRDDPSNQDVSFDRNWLRRRVLPVVVERWPEAVRSLSRSAALAGEADALLGELAALDLAAAGDDPARLPLMALGELSLPRQRLLIRHACQRLNLPTPPAARLQTLQGQLGARRDARVQVAWSGGEARTWRGALYLLAPLGEVPWGWSDDWDGHPGRMTPVGRVDQGLVPTEETGAVVLRLTLRRGGETLRVAGRGRRDVKRLLQEAGIPPWQRSRQLLVWHEGTLVAVLGVAAAQGWRLTA